MKAEEQPRAPAAPGLVRKGAPPTHTTLRRTQEPGPARPHPHRSGCWAPAGSPARTGIERNQASSRSGAGSSGSGTHLYLRWRQGKDSRGQMSGAAQASWDSSPIVLLVSGLGQISQDSHIHAYSPVSGDSEAEVAGDWGETWGWVGMGIRC